jgi:hypothetical protein
MDTGEDPMNANEGLADVDPVEDNAVGVESSSDTTSIGCVVG